MHESTEAISLFCIFGNVDKVKLVVTDIFPLPFGATTTAHDVDGSGGWGWERGSGNLGREGRRGG